MASSFAKLLLLCVCISYVCGDGRVELKLLNYNNPGGKGSNGHCCDGKWDACQANGCDYIFTICIDSRESTNSTADCKYVLKVSDDIDDQDNIAFGKEFGDVDNPIVFDFKGQTPLYSIKVNVEDDDGWTSNDHVDFLRYDMRSQQHFKSITLQSRTRLDAEVRVICKHNFYGPHCVYCVGNGYSYRCSQNGDKVCLPGWTGRDCTVKKVTTTTTTPAPTKPSYVERENADCQTLAKAGYRYHDDVYLIQPSNLAPFRTYCNMDSYGDGLTLIQRNVNNAISFDRNWADYKSGFGDPEPGNNFWMGLERIYHLTNTKEYSLFITLQVADGTFRHAQYEKFWIDNESQGYKIHLEGAGGRAGDAFAFSHGVKAQNGQRFSTPDRDNDASENFNCAERYSSGWWFSNCGSSNLNGPYIKPTNGWPSCNGPCMSWKTVEGFKNYALLNAEMLIIPRDAA